PFESHAGARGDRRSRTPHGDPAVDERRELPSDHAVGTGPVPPPELGPTSRHRRLAPCVGRGAYAPPSGCPPTVGQLPRRDRGGPGYTTRAASGPFADAVDPGHRARRLRGTRIRYRGAATTRVDAAQRRSREARACLLAR